MKETRNRIGSIDALRAFALLGILLVHTADLYFFPGAKIARHYPSLIRHLFFVYLTFVNIIENAMH